MDFKAKAENLKSDDVLAKIQGGDWSDCHGCSSGWAKAVSYLQAAFDGNNGYPIGTSGTIPR